MVHGQSHTCGYKTWNQNQQSGYKACSLIRIVCSQYKTEVCIPSVPRGNQSVPHEGAQKLPKVAEGAQEVRCFSEVILLCIELPAQNLPKPGVWEAGLNSHVAPVCRKVILCDV